MYTNWYKRDISDVNDVIKHWHKNDNIIIIKGNDECKLEDCIDPPSPMIGIKLSLPWLSLISVSWSCKIWFICYQKVGNNLRKKISFILINVRHYLITNRECALFWCTHCFDVPLFFIFHMFWYVPLVLMSHVWMDKFCLILSPLTIQQIMSFVYMKQISVT